MDFFRLDKQARRLFAVLAAAGGVYVLPLLLADRPYQDDLARGLYGSTGWDGDGRPLVTVLMQFLCGGGEGVVNLAPLPLILAVLTLCLALVLYARETLPDCLGRPLTAPVLLLVLLNPFAMANLSYQFDSFSMFFALSLAFVLYALPHGLAGPWLAAAGFAAGLLVMACYQPAAGMLLVLGAVELFFWALGARKDALRRELWRLGGVGAGALVYLTLVAPRFVDQQGWRSEASRVVSGPGTLKLLFNNLVSGAYYIRERLRLAPVLYRWALGLFAVTAVAAFLVRYLRTAGVSRGRRAAGCLVILLSPLAVLAASYLPLVFLQTMELSARMFLPFGGVLLFLGILLLRAFPQGAPSAAARWGCGLAGLALGLFVLFQYSYMAAYGTALKSQKEYETYLAYSIVHDVETLNRDGQYTQLSFSGTAPRCRQLQLLIGRYPFFTDLVPVYFSNSTWIGGAWVYYYLQYDWEITDLTDADTAALAQQPVLACTRYACFVNGDKILVQFR